MTRPYEPSEHESQESTLFRQTADRRLVHGLNPQIEELRNTKLSGKRQKRNKKEYTKKILLFIVSSI